MAKLKVKCCSPVKYKRSSQRQVFSFLLCLLKHLKFICKEWKSAFDRLAGQNKNTGISRRKIHKLPKSPNYPFMNSV